MLAACGAMMVSSLRYRCRCRSVGRRINVAPSERVGIKDPYPSHLFYSLPIISFTTENIHPLSNRNSGMSGPRSWNLAILSLSQARHAFIVYLSIMIALFLQRQCNDMDLLARQLPIFVLSTKDVGSARDDSEGVV